MRRRRNEDARPEGHDAIRIRVRVDGDEPPALAFHAQALPGALVSWAWCQLTALDALLQAVTDGHRDDDGRADVAGAVRSVLVPAINALAFAERRAHELDCEGETAVAKRRRKRRP